MLDTEHSRLLYVDLTDHKSTRGRAACKDHIGALIPKPMLYHLLSKNILAETSSCDFQWANNKRIFSG